MMIQSGMHGQSINECQSNDCRSYECRRNNCQSYECRRNNCRSYDCRSNETTPYFFSAGSLKQQSAGRHVNTLWNIILILSWLVFALFPYINALLRSNKYQFCSLWLDLLVLDLRIYSTSCEHFNHNTTDGDSETRRWSLKKMRLLPFINHLNSFNFRN